MRTRIGTLLGAAALALILAPAAPAQAQTNRDETPATFLQLVRTKYAASTWLRGTPRDGLPIALELEGWVGGPLRRMGTTLTRPYSREVNGPTSFLVETVVADTVDGAHAAVIDWLAGLQTAQVMPTAREVGFDVGDVAFVGRSGAARGAIAWIAFARGNVAVRLVAFDPRREPALDLAALSGVVDAAVQARPELAPGTAPTRPRIDGLAAGQATVAAGERVRLTLDVTDSSQGEPWIEWVVGGTAQGYVERATDGFTYLYTTGPGTLTLTAAVTSSTGTFADRSLQLAVTEER